MNRREYRLLVFREAQRLLRAIRRHCPEESAEVLVRHVLRRLAPRARLEREEWIGLAAALLIAARREPDEGHGMGDRDKRVRG